MNALDQLTDRELSNVFAVELAGWSCDALNRFATSADAVLPFLERMCFFTAGREPHLDGKPWYVAVAATEEEGPLNSGLAPTFARAACIALIKAKRAEASR
jgi:hypothetical protein